MKVQLCYYKAEGKIFDKLIRFWRKSLYSHVELLFGENTMFSADAWKNIVHFQIFVPNPASWDFKQIELTNDQCNKVLNFCKQEQNKKYDYFGIVHFVINIIRGSANRWFCSEICCRALQEVGLFEGLKPEEVAPDTLYNA